VSDIIVAHWNGQGGLLAGPNCDTWDIEFQTMEDAQAYARELEESSCDGWHCLAEAMTAGEYWDILAEQR
jgi:hypothetical protein